MNDAEIKVIRMEISKLQLNAGDTLVVKFNERLSSKRLARIKEAIIAVLPDDVNGLLFDDVGVDFSVVSGNENSEGQ